MSTKLALKMGVEARGEIFGQASRGSIERIGCAEFRMVLFADPDATLAGYALTEAELKALKSVDAESLDVCGGSVGRQILRNLAREYHSTGVDPPLARYVSLRQGPESISISPDPANGLGSAGALCLP